MPCRATADGEAGSNEKDGQGVAVGPPPPPVTGVRHGSSPAPAAGGEAAEEGGNGRGDGDGAVQPAPVSGGNSLVIEERRAMELWVDLLGICLLPFCSGGGEAAKAQRNGEPPAAAATAAADAERADDPLDSEDEDEDEDEEDGDDQDNDLDWNGRGAPGGGRARSGWVAGWMRRAGVSLAKPLECPFDIQPGGRDEELPRRLAVLTASHAKVKPTFIFIHC